MNLSAIASVLSMVASAAEANPKFAKIANYLLIVATAILMKQASVVVDGYTISASMGSVPSALTAGQLISAIEYVVLGQSGTIQSGDVVISVVKNAA